MEDKGAREGGRKGEGEGGKGKGEGERKDKGEGEGGKENGHRPPIIFGLKVALYYRGIGGRFQSEILRQLWKMRNSGSDVRDRVINQ